MPLGRLLPLFLVSGASALVYQVVWMRVLTLTLSVTVYAVTTVLCAFMGGLALGAFLAGRLADRLERPLLAFGAVEVGVGLCGLAVPYALFGLGPAYGWLAASLPGTDLALAGARFLLAAAVLLLPCTLMGMTLPLLSRAAVERTEQVGRGAGGLYAANTLGAVLGCVAAGFVLIPELGLAGTSQLAAAGNLGVGLTAAALGRRAAPRPAQALVLAPTRKPVPPQAALAALGFGISGFTALGYEVLWTRALEQFTHNSTYAYTIMLATFLLGIGAGSAATAWLAHRVRRPLAGFGALELAIGVSVLGSLLVYRSLLDWIPGAAGALGGLASWGRVLALIVGVAASTLLVTTSLFGATFPLVARAVVESERVVGRRVAFAYTVNTVGAILGALAVGFWLLPVLGLRGSFLALLGFNLVTGVVLLRADASPRTARLAAAAAGLAFAASLLLVPTRLFAAIFAARYGRLLLYREQITDTVMVTEGPDGERSIRYGDGRGTAGTASFREDRSYAHLAMLAHPDPRRVLSICFGVGNSLSSVAQYPIERVDAVELSPGVVHAAPFFRRTNRDVLSDPRVRLRIQDGRNHLLGTRERYDVIRLDPPELHTAGIVNLYTREFFELAREHLRPGGLFSIWVNIAYTPEPDLRAIVRTAAEVFPHLTVWHSPYLYSWVLNGSVEPHPPDLALLVHRFGEAPIRSDLASIGIDDPLELLSYFVMGSAEARAFAGDAPAITDDRTRLDFSVPRSVESYFGISNSITNDWLVDLMGRRESLVAKSIRLCGHKRPVLPHLAHPEALGLAPEALAEEIDARLRALPHGCTGAALASGSPLRGERGSAGGRPPGPAVPPPPDHSR